MSGSTRVPCKPAARARQSASVGEAAEPEGWPELLEVSEDGGRLFLDVVLFMAAGGTGGEPLPLPPPPQPEIALMTPAPVMPRKRRRSISPPACLYSLYKNSDRMRRRY